MSVVRTICLSALLVACNTEVDLGFRNATPSALIASPSDEQTLFQGVSQRFRGIAQDLDDSYEDLTVTWSANNEELCPPSSPNEIGDAFCDIALDAGPTEITFVVSDGSLRDEDVQVFWARPSAPPSAEITSLDPGLQYYADQQIQFEGLVSDIEDEAEDLEVRWESNIQGPLPAVDASVLDGGVVSGAGLLDEGDHLIRLFVTDSAGNETFDSALVRVGPENRPPECLGIDFPVNGQVFRSGSGITFTAEVSDPDVPSNFLTVRWETDKLPGVILGTSIPSSNGDVTFPLGGLADDTHLVTLTAEDPFGQTCTSNVVVVLNAPPTVQLTSPLSNAVYAANTPIDFTAMVDDFPNPADSLSLLWEDEFDGVVTTLNTNTPASDGSSVFARSDLAAGQHTMTLTATDNSGLSTQAQVAYRVNGLPGPVDVVITPEIPNGADTLAAQLDFPSVDPDGDPVTYAYAWYRDEILRSALNTASVAANETAKGERWRVQVTPSDAYGSGPVASASVVIRNTPPDLEDVSIQGGPFFETSTITCLPGLGVDPDLGDSVSYLYGWTVNGGARPVDTATLAGDWFDKDDVVQCSATPTDGVSQGMTVTSGDVTILNTPPQVAEISITPSSPEGTDRVECLWTYTDADEDTSRSTVTWRVNSVDVDTGATLDAPVSAGDVITCVVTANDGDVDGNSLTANATVVESAPTIDSVDVRPNTATAATPLTCEYSGFTDPQGEADESRYAWTVNGTPVSTSPTLSVGYGKDDVVVCTVTPSDGGFDGTPLSDSVTIRNSPPTQPILEITPEFPLAGLDDLVCSFNTRSTDPDGDPISYTFSWTVEGSSFFGATDEEESSTIPSSEFGGLETWVCTATPTDGEDTGPSGTASVFTLPSIAPKVATGSVHSCKLDRRGEVACWGLDQLGRLAVPGELFLDIDAGFEYTCGIITDGSLRCWGVETVVGFQFFPPAGEYTSVGAGVDYACATTPNSGIVCWGDPSDADGLIADAPTTGQFTQVTVGDRHVCAVRVSGQLLCWGNNGQNQVTGRTSLPRPTGTVVSVTAGALHNCALLPDGSIQCWGNNFGGRATPAAGNDFVDVASGIIHSCGIRDDGSATCWGFDNEGRATPPTVDSSGNTIIFVSADLTNHSCGIESSGRAFCWGPNDDGQASPP
ncbi:MAG: hypothetical protein ACJAZO_000679 [Myxococcota bacterium]|jgi:hypothetical protein